MNFRLRAVYLIVGEVVFIVTTIWWPAVGPVPFWSAISSALLFGLGGYVIAHRWRWLSVYIPLCVVAILCYPFGHTVTGNVVREICFSLIFAMLFGAVLSHSWWRAGVPHADRLLAGIAGYLLLGVFWSAQFAMLINLGLDPLEQVGTGSVVGLRDSIYFSFITMACVGYGDIVPVTPVARVLAIFTALSGVLYLGVFISSLIGTRRE